MKRCFKCGEEKDFSLFYKHKGMLDGRLNKCIECTKLDVKSHRIENIEKVREYDKSRSMNPDRVKARASYAKSDRGREVHRRNNRDYYANNTERVSESKRRWVEKNPKKRAVHGVTGYAIKCGLLKKMPCIICGDEKSHAHHCDYDKPLDVIWLCALHHADWHSKNGEGLNPF